MEQYIFEIQTPLGFSVHCTNDYWEFIITQKHPIMKDHLEDVKESLANPDEIRKSKKDENVYLFYKEHSIRWICSVAKEENNSGFLITAYPTDSIKTGEIIWKK